MCWKILFKLIVQAVLSKIKSVFGMPLFPREDEKLNYCLPFICLNGARKQMDKNNSVSAYNMKINKMVIASI